MLLWYFPYNKRNKISLPLTLCLYISLNGFLIIMVHRLLNLLVQRDQGTREVVLYGGEIG